MQSIHDLRVGDLVRVVHADEVRGLVQTTYEDWLYHKSKWEGQVGTVVSFDPFLNGKAQVLLQNEIAYISKTFLAIVQSPSADDTMHQEVRNGTGNRKTEG